MSGILVGSTERTAAYWKLITGSSITTCYTNAGPKASKGVSVFLVNESGGTVNTFIYWRDSAPWDGSSAADICIGIVPIEDDRSYTFDLTGLSFENGDLLKVTAANGFTVTVNVTEYPGPG